MSAAVETGFGLAGLLSLTVWIVLFFFRGGFWRADQRLNSGLIPPAPAPAVVAVIPARNEVATIAGAVRSILDQGYPGPLSIIVVDDNSTDGTAGALGAFAETGSVTVLNGGPLPDGWTGKMWAVSQGLALIDTVAPDAEYVLLTDADIAHGDGVLARLVAKAQTENRDLVSLMVLLRTDRFWERFLCPAFVFFFQKLYPFPWVNNPAKKTAGAAGGCMLVRRSALDRIGGVGEIRNRVIDDCALAAEIKKGGSIWLGLADASHSLRGYDGLSGLWNMVARTAFVQLRQSWWLLIGTVLGMGLIYGAPPVSLIAGVGAGDPVAAIAGAAALLFMIVAYIPTLRLYGRPWLEAAGLPVAAMIYAVMTVGSAIRTLRGAGASWKGRSYGDIAAPDKPSGNDA